MPHLPIPNSSTESEPVSYRPPDQPRSVLQSLPSLHQYPYLGRVAGEDSDRTPLVRQGRC